MTTTSAHPQLTCSAILRRQPGRVRPGHPDGGFAEAYDAYELICLECGDDPSQDYGKIPPRLQRLRGPYWLAPGLSAYEQHLAFHNAIRGRPTARPERVASF